MFNTTFKILSRILEQLFLVLVLKMAADDNVTNFEYNLLKDT